MEILLTFLSAVDCAFSEAPKPFLEDFLLTDMNNQSIDDLRLHLPHCNIAAGTSTIAGHNRSYSTDFDLGYPLRQRSVSENTNLKTHKRYSGGDKYGHCFINLAREHERGALRGGVTSISVIIFINNAIF